MATGRPVRLVLDASLLLDPSSTREAAAVALRPGVEELLRRLRYSNLSVRGAFPIYPSKGSLIFVPLSFEIPLSLQLQEVDMVLHKITDEIVKIDPNCSIDFPKGISFSAGMSEIISLKQSLIVSGNYLYIISGKLPNAVMRFVEEHPDFCIMDPFKNIYPLLDRLQIQKILVRLQELGTEGKPKLRAPYSCKVDSFHNGELDKHLVEANLSFPLIVKPQVACGVADAHNMEYVDHGSKIFKFYVIGDKVFYAVRDSMPNARFLKPSSGGEALTFNSLKTLPVATNEQRPQTGAEDGKLLDADLVEEAAKFLKGLLGLTVFGFDVVVQEGTGDHVIVDLNYLPSFKEVPDSEAVPAFWDAVRQAYESTRGNANAQG
ncbi:Inositol 134-trisphosphate 5/6-kinase 4 [Zea mays]|uniref:inositol-1,3,4-trisphosphate 5/6-kinase n=1 Tax=Zea mays TaxID=4577 RepID=A0A1D6I8P6_MAIZE|nr:Inositol 134-trisphosphate 5/6-kinase 4 [Zea mays]